MARTAAGRLKNPWHPAALLLILVAPFLDILLSPGGRILGDSRCDNPSAYYFYSYYLGQCLRQGTVPLWNPYIMLGLPFLADGEASVFHPLSVLFAFLRTGMAINWLIAISFVLTGMFFYGYLRALRLGRAAAWCGAVTWSFSSAMISRIYAGHLNILLTYISIPLIMMLWENYRAGGGVRHLLGIAAAYALMLLAWYPQLLYTFSLFFLLYVLIQSGLAVIARPTAAWGEARAIGLLGVFIVLGIGLGAIQLLPSLDFVGRSFRQSATIGFCGIFSFPPENFLTLLVPSFFGTGHEGAPATYWGRCVYWEMWLYLGMLPLMLAAAGAWAAPRRRGAALLACGAIFLVLGLGKNTPLFPFIYRHVPFFDIFRGSSKNLVVTLFCLVTLSAYGFDALLGGAKVATRRRTCRIALGAGGLVFVFTAGLLALTSQAETAGSPWQRFINWVWSCNERYFLPAGTVTPEFACAAAAGAARAAGRTLILISLSMALLALHRPARRRGLLFPAAAVLILVDLLSVFLPLRQSFDRSMTQLPLDLDERAVQYPYPPRILNPSEMPNLAIRSGYSAVFGYAGNTLRRYNDFISLVQGEAPNVSRAESKFKQLTPHYQMLAFDAVAVDPQMMPSHARPIGRLGERLLVPFEQIFGDKLPRAFLAAAPRYFALREQALAYVFSTNVDVQANPAIERQGAPLEPHPLEPGESVRFVSFTAQRVELEAATKWPRELVLCGMFERNWKAEVNGVPAPVEPANTIFRAVRVPAGTSRVIFEYRPAAFYRGLAVTAVSAAILLLIGMVAFIHSRPNRRKITIGMPPLDWGWLWGRWGWRHAPEHYSSQAQRKLHA